MLISLLSFYFIASFLHLLTSSVSLTIEKRCTTNNDCDLELICNTETNTCTCPKPYFWRDDLHACVGCAPGWLELQRRKCLLFAISPVHGHTWHQAQTTCEELIAQPLIINNRNEFQALQHQIEYILNGVNALSAILYFHQGAWVEINNKWIESYPWCNKDEKGDFLDCIQIRQDNRTNAICLQYVSCLSQSHFICEAPPLLQFELEKNMAEIEHAGVHHRNKELMVRHPRQVTIPSVQDPSNIQTGNQMMMTTKKPSSFNAENIMNLFSTGLQTVGQVSNAIGNIFGKSSTQQTAVADNSYNYNQQQYMAQALASNTDGNANSSSSNLLFYGGLIGGFLLLIIIISVIICVVCSKKKTSSNSKSSIRSTESGTSVVSNE